MYISCPVFLPSLCEKEKNTCLISSVADLRFASILVEKQTFFFFYQRENKGCCQESADNFEERQIVNSMEKGADSARGISGSLLASVFLADGIYNGFLHLKDFRSKDMVTC
jgi:hypothetical protein